MPSGAKKRKAAKKKKELESHGQNNNQQPHSGLPQIDETDDLKRHDGKESEGEDVSSPSSHDLANHQHQLTDEENEEAGRKNGVAVKETVLKNPDACQESLKTDSEFNNIGQHVDSPKESGVGVLSQTLNEDSVNVHIEGESELHEKLDKSAAVQDIEYEKEPGGGGLLEGDSCEPHVIDKMNVVVDNTPFPSSTEATDMLAEGLIQVPIPVLDGESHGSVTELGMDTDPDNSGLVEKISMYNVTSGDNSVPAKQGSEEKCKKEADALDQKDTSFVTREDSGLENKKAEAVAANDTVGVSYARNSTTQETKETFLSDVTQRDQVVNLGHANNSDDFMKSHDNQPLLGSAAQPVQRTSWMSCCGLLDVFIESSR